MRSDEGRKDGQGENGKVKGRGLGVWHRLGPTNIQAVVTPMLIIVHGQSSSSKSSICLISRPTSYIDTVDQ